jgi:hypothetical protein
MINNNKTFIAKERLYFIFDQLSNDLREMTFSNIDVIFSSQMLQ